MELRHLRYFVAVADRLNFRQAADDLHVTQPALSAQIKDLEAELAVRLLERNTRAVRLTEAGGVFLERARLLLAGAAEATAAARAAASGHAGRLLVGNISAFSAGFMSPNLAAFRAAFPQVEVTLVPLGMSQHLAALLSGEIQVGFTMGPRDPFPPSIVRQPLLRTPFHVYVGRTHPLARARTVPLAALTRVPFLAISYDRKRTSLMESQVRQIFAGRQLPFPPVELVDGFEGILTMLISGHGFTIMPTLTGALLPASIVQRPFAERGPDLVGELSALHRVGETSPVVPHFLASLERWSLRHYPSRPAPRRRAARA